MAVSPRPTRFRVATGPFQGKWIRYRSAPGHEPRVAACGRCGARTHDAGATGWYYCRAERRAGRQVCPACAVALGA